jgi:hypothetical protein
MSLYKNWKSVKNVKKDFQREVKPSPKTNQKAYTSENDNVQNNIRTFVIVSV